MDKATYEKLTDTARLEEIENKGEFLLDLADSILMQEVRYSQEDAGALVYALAYLGKAVASETLEPGLTDEDKSYLARTKEAYRITRENLSETIKLRGNFSDDLHKSTQDTMKFYQAWLDQNVMAQPNQGFQSSSELPTQPDTSLSSITDELKRANAALADFNRQFEPHHDEISK